MRAASTIVVATCALLKERGCKVIGVDIHDSDPALRKENI